MLHPRLYKRNTGLAIVLLMIILVVATAIGIWGLTSSRSSMLKAGSRKFTTELTYQAEQGLQKAVRRIQSIATNTGADDQAASTNAASTAPVPTNGDTAQKTIAFLITSICEESACGAGVNQACTNFDAAVDFDQVNANVVCNFLGLVDKNTQVSIVRKNNLVVSGTETFAIFLVNSIATDTSGRKQAIQGVVVVPFSAAGPSSTGAPYLASSKAVTD